MKVIIFRFFSRSTLMPNSLNGIHYNQRLDERHEQPLLEVNNVLWTNIKPYSC